MALAGALMVAHGGSTAELRVAMLAGLLHDLGEMYIDPRYGEADADRTLDLPSYRHLVVHPHVGQLLITQLTEYPAVLGRAIAEHHERLDGSGYPHALQRDSVSSLGRLLAVTESALGVLRGERPELSRVSIALRVVPGEFDLTWLGPIAAAVQSPAARGAEPDVAQVQARLTRLDGAMQAAQYRAAALVSTAESPALKGALELTQYLLGRLRTGWYASGLWSSEAVTAQDAAEVESVEDELFFRLHAIERAAQLRAGELSLPDANRLDLLCDSLRAVRQ
jgi:hypothetical protein